MIGYDWAEFRLAWMPLSPGTAPRFDSIRYYHAGKRQWFDTPDSSDGYGLFSYPSQYTHISLSWRHDAHCWILLYATASDIGTNFGAPAVARFSQNLIDWSDPVSLFDPVRDRAYSHYMHQPAIDRINPDVPPSQPPGKDNPGWAYGAFLIDRFTRWDGPTRILSMVYLLSLSSPYQVQLMNTTVRLPDPITTPRSFQPRELPRDV
jgi:hypothetical protein